MKKIEASNEDEKYHLLSRTPPLEYIDEWTKLIESPSKRRVMHQVGSVLVFRLFNDLLALPAKTIKAVAEPKKSHRIPSHRADLVTGVVNINGQLRILISLHSFLEIKSSMKELPFREASPHPRMIVITEESKEFVFMVDELFGVFPFDPSTLRKAPTDISLKHTHYLKGIISWGKSTPIGLIDEGLLFYNLRKIFHANG